MTAIVQDMIIYNRKNYEVLNSGRLFNVEKKYSLKLSKGATDNPSGFHCDFGIEDQKLFLLNLSFQTLKKPSKGFLGIGHHPPDINGISPFIENETAVAVWDILYKGIYLMIPFSGTLTIGARGIHAEGLEDIDYDELIKLEFKNGMLLNS